MTRWTRVLLIGTLAFGAAVPVAAFVLMRDPGDRFRRRHAPINRVEESPVSVIDERHVARTARIASESGLAVELGVKWPLDPVRADTAAAGANPVRRPLILILGGHVTGREAISLIPDTHGTIVAAASYPFDGNHRVKGLAVLRELPAIRGAILDTPPALMLALDYLLGRPDVDPSRVELVGVSLGAPFAVIAGALDPRATRIWSIHGAGNPYELLEHNLHRYIPVAPLRHIATSIGYAFMSGPHIAPERYAGRIAPRPFVMINAEGDEKMPRANVEELFASANEPKSIVWMEGKHVLGRRKDIVQRLISIVLERVAPPADSGSAVFKGSEFLIPPGSKTLTP